MKKLSSLLIAAASALVLTSCSTSSDTATTPATTSASASASSTSSSAAATNAPTLALPNSSSVSSDDAPAAAGTPITITAGDTVITATLNDSQVSQDFIQTLPVTLPWFRNAGIEYITELPAPMTETGPFYTDVQPGDLVYYNPRDSITIIYEETSSVPTLTYMGEITSDLSVFRDLPDDVDMVIALG